MEGQAEFTKKEAAAALVMGAAAFQAHVRRHRLPATGRGKARRFPRSTVELVHERARRGVSTQTANYYLRELKSFCRWMVKDRRAGESPVAHLSGGNARLDRRHDSRPLSADELRQLIQAARRTGRAFRGLSGPDRAALYCAASATGLRAGELSSLTPADFSLDTDPPTVSLSARDAKNGRTVVQPLPGEVAGLLRDYLAGRDPDRPVWPGGWSADGAAAEMLRIDLEPAGIPYAIDGPDGPLYADFHALRHSFIALLDRSGATL